MNDVSETKHCSACSKDIDPRAVACRYCGAPQTFILRHVRSLNTYLMMAILAVLLFQYAGERLFAGKAASDALERRLAQRLLREAIAADEVNDLRARVQNVREQPSEAAQAESALKQAEKKSSDLGSEVEQLWKKAAE
ncbi:MAG: hypothetical protein ACLPPF_21015 [Rhodomicrobium sp.]